ncbi:MAG: Rpn family recombination-promoting nuclease/putative transposase [Lachnospiraceae bacterium]|nr:Rpn family recombination-promoting nuclease/putative transposase [Lachnospiraceae bacterium]
MKKTNLRQYFPILRTRADILAEIGGKPHLDAIFKSWKKEQQEEFLDFCSGAKGCKMMYDTFFKKVMDPVKNRDRLERFLSIVLKKKVRILQVLPNESRMTAEDSLLIMDIVVELEDGSIANVEMQKIGYAFPGQRTSCYSADLLLRQYQRVKINMKSKGKAFSYQHIKDVYTIILFDKSPQEFKGIPNQYIHRGSVCFDTKLQIHMPQEFIYIPLDIFREVLHNNGIVNELEAWLTFLCEDEPEIIGGLIQQYPYFRELYHEVYKLCENLEDIMGYFSEALQEMDRNTVQYMIEEQQAKIEENQAELSLKDAKIEEQQTELARKDAKIAELERLLAVAGK